MTQCNGVKVKLSTSKLNKIKINNQKSYLSNSKAITKYDWCF